MRPSSARRSPTLGRIGSSDLDGDLGASATRWANTAARSSSDRRRARRTSARACARRPRNSSTIRPMSPTWRTMVSGAAVEGLQCRWARSPCGTCVAAEDPFGGKLDGRQRVLDLVGDAAGDIPPGGVALGGHQAGDVVEGQHHALGALRLARTRRQSRLRSAGHVDILLRPRPAAAGGASSATAASSGATSRQRVAGGDGLPARPSNCAAWRLTAEMRLPRVEADDPGADPQQHGLGEKPSRFGFNMGRPQGLLLLLKIAGHPVEGARQHGDLVGIEAGVDPRGEVAGGDASCRLHQACDGRGDPVGRRHTQPHGAHQHQEDGLEIGQREGSLDQGAAGAWPWPRGRTPARPRSRRRCWKIPGSSGSTT